MGKDLSFLRKVKQTLDLRVDYIFPAETYKFPGENSAYAFVCALIHPPERLTSTISIFFKCSVIKFPISS